MDGWILDNRQPATDQVKEPWWNSEWLIPGAQHVSGSTADGVHTQATYRFNPPLGRDIRPTRSI